MPARLPVLIAPQKGRLKMARKTKQILSLLMAFMMACSLLAVPVAAEDTTITFDISKGSVTADAYGVTGYTADGNSKTVP